MPAAVTIANTLEYAGCKSWVPLNDPVDIIGAMAALSDARINDLKERISTAFRV